MLKRKMTGRAKINYGLLGELYVEACIVREGWHPVRLNAAQLAANADLFAIRGLNRVSIQVKTTEGASAHSHSNSVGFGYADRYLSSGAPIFNTKPSPLICDIVVAVNLSLSNSTAFVLPVAFAEALCRLHCDYWNAQAKRDGDVRSPKFPIYLRIDPVIGSHSHHHARIARNLASFQERWDLLGESIDRLHAPEAWPIEV